MTYFISYIIHLRLLPLVLSSFMVCIATWPITPMAQPDQDIIATPNNISTNTPYQLAQEIIQSNQDSTPSAVEIQQTAAIMLHVGLPEYAGALLDEYFREQGTWTIRGHLLRARAYRLEMELRSISVLAQERPLQDIVTDQLAILQPATTHLETGITQLRQQATKTADVAAEFTQLRYLLRLEQGRIYQAKGDIIYRLQGPTLLGQVSGGTTSHSALAEYQKARESVAEALLIKHSVAAQILSDAIDERISWLANRKAFGGRAFFELPIYFGQPSDTGQTPTQRGRLNQLLDADSNHNLLARMAQQWQVQRRQGLQQVNSIRQRLQNRQLRKQQRRQALVRTLIKEIEQIRHRIKELGYRKGSALERQQVRLQGLLLNDQQMEQQFRQALAARRQELIAATQQVTKLQHKLNKYADRKDIIGFMQTTGRQFSQDLQKLLTASQGYGRTWGQLVSGEASNAEADMAVKALTREITQFTQGVTTKLQATSLKIQQAQARLSEFVHKMAAAKQNLQERTEQELRQELQIQMEKTKGAVLALEEKLVYAIKDGSSDVARLRNRLEQTVMNELERRKQQVLDAIGEAEKYTQDAMGFIEDYRRGEVAVKSVLTAAQVAITAAGQIPTGIIAGMANGVFTNTGSATIEAIKAGMEVAKQTSRLIVTIQEAKDRVHRLKAGLQKFRNKLSKINMTMVQQELKTSLQRVRDAAQVQVQEFKQRIVQRKKDIQHKAQALAKSQLRSLKLRYKRIESIVAAFKSQVEQHQIAVKIVTGERTQQRNQVRYLMGQIEVAVARLKSIQAEVKTLAAEYTAYQQRSNDIKSGSKALSNEAIEQLDADARVLYTRIQTLEKRIKQIKAGKADLPSVAMPMDELAALATRPSLARQLDTYQQHLEEANQLLFTYANWLYSMTGNPTALKWAIQVQNPGDAKIVFNKLKAVEGSLTERKIASEILPFSIRIRPQDLTPAQRKLFSISNTISFSINPYLQLPANHTTLATDFEWPEGYKEYNHIIVDPVPGMLTFPIARLQCGQWLTLLDAFVEPVWKEPRRFQERRVVLEAAGPAFAMVNNRLSYFPARIGKQQGDQQFKVYKWAAQPIMDQASTRQRIIPLLNIMNSNTDLKHLLYGGRAYNVRQVFGRPPGGDWLLKLPQRWARSRITKPTFADLQEIRVTFVGLASQTTDTRHCLTQSQAYRTQPVVPWRADVKNPGIYGQTLLAYEDEVTHQETKATYKHSAAGIQARLTLLKKTYPMLPTYSQMTQRTKPELSQEQRNFLLNNDHLMNRWMLATRSTKHQHGQDPMNAVDQAANWVIREELLGATTAPEIISPIRLGSIWPNLRNLLENVDNNGLLDTVRQDREDLEAMQTTLTMVVKTLQPIQLMIRRLTLDLNMAQAQPTVLAKLKEGLKAISTNDAVRYYIKQQRNLIEFYSTNTGWLIKWAQAGDAQAAQLQPYLLEQLLNKIQAIYGQILEQRQQRNTTPVSH